MHLSSTDLIESTYVHIAAMHVDMYSESYKLDFICVYITFITGKEMVFVIVLDLYKKPGTVLQVRKLKLLIYCHAFNVL